MNWNQLLREDVGAPSFGSVKDQLRWGLEKPGLVKGSLPMVGELE